MENSHVIHERQNSSNFKIINRDYIQVDFNLKPEGFWYQIDESWEKFRKGVLNFDERSSKVNLKIDKTNVLIINTLEKFDSFYDKYCSASVIFSSPQTAINWLAVSEDYDGIEIPYYFRERRMDLKHFWYYPWDVACGCIWNTDIITVVGKPVPTQVYCCNDHCTMKPQESTGYCSPECQEEMEMEHY